MRKYIIYVMVLSFMTTMFLSCGSSRDVSQRRGLMMPKRSEVYVNARKYKEREHFYTRR